MKKAIPLIALLLTLSCTPKYIIPLTEENKKNFEEFRRLSPNFYKLSPTGEAHFEGGYISWDEKGVTIFIKK